MTLDDIFATDGLIAQAKPGYELREEQIEVARLVASAISDGRNAIIEAGTGVGKSFALVVPAALSGKRIVISTETNTLLDQYAEKDLPFLASILGDLQFARAKGKNNYVCKRAIDEYLGQPMLPGYTDAQEVMALVEWAKTTKTGDRSEPCFGFSDASWSVIGADEYCPRSKCPYYIEGARGYSACFAYQARKRFLDARIVVTNHALCLLNAWIGGDAILGDHEVCIFDEAHSLAEWAQRTFGSEFKQRTLSSFAKYVLRVCKLGDMPITFETHSLEHHEQQFFDAFRALDKPQMTFRDLPTPILDESRRLSEPVISEMQELRAAVNRLTPNTEDEEKLLGELDDRAREHVKALKSLYEPDANWLPFVEFMGNGDFREKRVSLHYKPVDVAPLLASKVFDQRDSTILASATMAVGGRFEFPARDLGVPDPVTLKVGSPFDYAEQCVGYFPLHLPEQRDPTYHTAIADELMLILTHTFGRAFVLFTSYRDLEAVYALVSPRLKFTMLKQGDLPKPALIERFKDDTHSVLFATRSFFTGVDIPGEALSCVVLVKAPFRVPTEPLFAAKCAAIKQAGGNDFAGYALPLMIGDMRQAFGRLIRNKTDRGVFAFLDSRTTKKPYFKWIRASLPDMRFTTRLA